MSGFRDERFPDSVAEGATGGPEFSTDIVESGSGGEDRNQRWAKARWRYNISTGIKDATTAAAAFAFLLAVAAGRAFAFAFKDFADFQATAQNIGTGDNSTTTFQLIKTYTYGSYSYVRTIKLPVAATVKIYLDGALQTTGYTLSSRGASGGVVTFSSHPGSGVVITWTGEFDVPVRFDADYNAGNVFSAAGLMRFENLGLVEVRL